MSKRSAAVVLGAAISVGAGSVVDSGEHRVGRVGLGLVGEVDPGDQRFSRPRANTETSMCGACARRRGPAPARLDGDELEAALGVGRAAAEAAEAVLQRHVLAASSGWS